MFFSYKKQINVHKSDILYNIKYMSRENYRNIQEKYVYCIPGIFERCRAIQTRRLT